MARSRNLVPKYELHKRSGSARVRWCGNTVWLGKYGTPESLKEYARVCAEIQVARHPVPRPARTRVSVFEVLLAFIRHAEMHYRGADGTLTSEFREYTRSIHHLAPLYGHTPANEFGPIALQTVRQKMIEAGWCRLVINKRIVRVRSIFRWGVAQELVSPEVVTALECVQGLQRGRCAAPETTPVLPAPLDDVRQVLPLLDRHQCAMVRLQLLTGMRPGEVCVLRLCELDRTGSIWMWRPELHKTKWRGRVREILFGPRAQEVVSTFLDGFTPELRPHERGWLFSPYTAREERYAAARRARKSKIPPSQQRRERLANPARRPGARFDVGGYGHALVAACEKAGVPKFLPNQLRHTFATLVRKNHGLEAAQVLLGHAKADVTQIYAARDLELARKIIGEIG